MVGMSTIDAARTAHVTVRQLNHWASCGWVHPRREVGKGQGGSYLAWPVEEVDRAEMLGVLSRSLNPVGGLLPLLADAIEHGTSLVLSDGDYDVVIAWRATTKKGTEHGHGTTLSALP